MSELSEYRVISSPNENAALIDNADELSLEAQEARRFEQDTRHRHTLVVWMMWVVSIWLAVVLIITVFNKICCFGIDESVLITLLATTTLNVLGLSRIVLGGLFGYHRHKCKNIFGGFNK